MQGYSFTYPFFQLPDKPACLHPNWEEDSLFIQEALGPWMWLGETSKPPGVLPSPQNSACPSGFTPFWGDIYKSCHFVPSLQTCPLGRAEWFTSLLEKGFIEVIPSDRENTVPSSDLHSDFPSLGFTSVVWASPTSCSQCACVPSACPPDSPASLRG